MKEIKFRYIFKNEIFNDISIYYLTLKEIENGDLNKILKSGMIENGYKIIARDLFIGYKDINNKDIYSTDTLKISGNEYYSNDSISLDNDWTFIGKIEQNSYMWLVLAEDKTYIPFYDILQNNFEIEIINKED